jgi:hypothetical protein
LTTETHKDSTEWATKVGGHTFPDFFFGSGVKGYLKFDPGIQGDRSFASFK